MSVSSHEDSARSGSPDGAAIGPPPNEHDHKHKRRRLEQQIHSQYSLADLSQSFGDPPFPPNFPPPPWLTPISQPASAFPFTTSADGLWEEGAAIEYLTSGAGFIRDLQAFAPPVSDAYNPASVPPPAPNPPRSPVASHPGRFGQPPSPRHAFAYRPAPENFSPPLNAGWSPERMRDVGERVPPEMARYVAHVEAPPDSHVLHAQNFQPPPHMQRLDLYSGPPVQRRSLSQTAAAPARPAIMLVLRRATTESIATLDEHKRECPACQLVFEPDHFMAVISCCDTAMHATCLSAWVNSQTYAKSRTCMKCRRPIDARRMLNNIIPPVSDKNWDEGVGFNAPMALKGDATIQLKVTPKPDRTAYRRHWNSDYASPYGARHFPALPDPITSEMRRSLMRAREAQDADLEAMRRHVSERSREHHHHHHHHHNHYHNHAAGEPAARGETHRGCSVDLAMLDRQREDSPLSPPKTEQRCPAAHGECLVVTRGEHRHQGALGDDPWADPRNSYDGGFAPRGSPPAPARAARTDFSVSGSSDRR